MCQNVPLKNIVIALICPDSPPQEKNIIPSKFNGALFLPHRLVTGKTFWNIPLCTDASLSRIFP